MKPATIEDLVQAIANETLEKATFTGNIYAFSNPKVDSLFYKHSGQVTLTRIEEVDHEKSEERPTEKRIVYTISYGESKFRFVKRNRNIHDDGKHAKSEEREKNEIHIKMPIETNNETYVSMLISTDILDATQKNKSEEFLNIERLHDIELETA